MGTIPVTMDDRYATRLLNLRGVAQRTAFTRDEGCTQLLAIVPRRIVVNCKNPVSFTDDSAIEYFGAGSRNLRVVEILFHLRRCSVKGIAEAATARRARPIHVAFAKRYVTHFRVQYIQVTRQFVR